MLEVLYDFELFYLRQRIFYVVQFAISNLYTRINDGYFTV